MLHVANSTKFRVRILSLSLVTPFLLSSRLSVSASQTTSLFPSRGVDTLTASGTGGQCWDRGVLVEEEGQWILIRSQANNDKISNNMS